MEQNTYPRNKCTHKWSINFGQRRQKYTGERIVSLMNGDGETRHTHAE